NLRILLDPATLIHDGLERLPPRVLVHDVVNHGRLHDGLHGTELTAYDARHDSRCLDTAVPCVEVWILFVREESGRKLDNILGDIGVEIVRDHYGELGAKSLPQPAQDLGVSICI